jgi:hypothetical protein
MRTAEGKKRLQAYLIKYRNDNYEEISAQKADYYKRNADHLRQYQKEYRRLKKHLTL